MPFPFAVVGAEPDLDRSGDLKQVIDVPVRCRRGFQVVANAGAQAA
jgi:hypothetical protein